MTVTVEYLPAGSVTAAPVRPRPVRRAAVPARRPVTTVRSRVTAGTGSCVAAAPQPVAASSAVQLTRRGWVALLSAAVAVAAVLVWIAFLSHPAAGPAATGPAPTQVVVQSGDTLWSIASRVAPGRDPRAVVYDLQQSNHLADSTVVAGQVLHLG